MSAAAPGACKVCCSARGTSAFTSESTARALKYSAAALVRPSGRADGTDARLGTGKNWVALALRSRSSVAKSCPFVAGTMPCHRSPCASSWAEWNAWSTSCRADPGRAGLEHRPCLRCLRRGRSADRRGGQEHSPVKSCRIACCGRGGNAFERSGRGRGSAVGAADPAVRDAR